MKAARPGDATARTRGLLLIAFLALLVLVINGSQWIVLRRVTHSVEAELGLRLVTVAQAAVDLAEPDLLLAADVASDSFVRLQLEELLRRHDLADVFLLDPDGILLFDLDGGPVGESNPFLALDFEAFSRAVAGVPAASRFVDVEGALLKAAYAPVRLDDADPDAPVEAVLGVTAGGDFHQRLPELRRRLVGISLGSGVLVVLLGVLFLRMLHRLARTESALARSETLGAMGMMAAGVAHEVRNPLAIIAGTAQRLKRRYGESADDPLFDSIPEEVERLNGILEGYLRFARDEPLAFSDVDLSDLVRRCASLVREEFAAQGVRVTAEDVDDPSAIRADPHRLQQVLLNLLLNAAQAMPDGGEVRMSVRGEGDGFRVTVEDEGSGFDAKALRDAFQPFFTTKEQGSGLGLAMARRIVEGHGGRIEAANRPAGGAVVTVTLPRTPAAEGDGWHPSSS